MGIQRIGSAELEVYSIKFRRGQQNVSGLHYLPYELQLRHGVGIGIDTHIRHLVFRKRIHQHFGHIAVAAGGSRKQHHLLFFPDGQQPIEFVRKRIKITAAEHRGRHRIDVQGCQGVTVFKTAVIDVSQRITKVNFLQCTAGECSGLHRGDRWRKDHRIDLGIF